MEEGMVRVMSFRDPVRKLGVTYADESEEEKTVLGKITADLKARWALTIATLSSLFSGHHAGPALEPDSGEASPTHLKSPVVVQKLWNQSSSKYSYCGCVRVKVAVTFGLVLDLLLITVYIVVIIMAALDWRAAVEQEQGSEDTSGTPAVSVSAQTGDYTTTEVSSTAPGPLKIENKYPLSQVYESYLVATIADASMAIISVVCLMYGMAKNRPSFLIPEICLACVIVGVKIIQLSKQASDGTATPFSIWLGVVETFFSLWFAHVVYLYRKYLKDRNAFLAAHTRY